MSSLDSCADGVIRTLHHGHQSECLREWCCAWLGHYTTAQPCNSHNTQNQAQPMPLLDFQCMLDVSKELRVGVWAVVWTLTGTTTTRGIEPTIVISTLVFVRAAPASAPQSTPPTTHVMNVRAECPISCPEAGASSIGSSRVPPHCEIRDQRSRLGAGRRFAYPMVMETQ